MLIVLLLHLQKDENIVQEDKKELSQHIKENILYQRLEDSVG